MMGYGARLAFGCNIGAYFSGMLSGSLHAWLWLPAAVRQPRRAPPGRGMRGVAPGIAAMARRADALTAPGTVPRTRDLR